MTRFQMSDRWPALITWGGLSLALSCGSSAGAVEDISFNRDIKPILADNCFTCHGPDEQKRAAELRLDLFDGATRPAESGEAAIVPGDSRLSPLLKRVASADPSMQMPPPETGKRLTEHQIQLLTQWIENGAGYQAHWAFTAPIRPAVPAAVPQLPDNIPASDHPIDRFVRAQLAAAGLAPSPPADRLTLVRRVSLDLTGLPPTPEQIDMFVSDHSPAAYERMVDRFLMSSAYGERMAVSWLDFARYADSNGFQSDGSRDIWAWRDWVIRAYNSNQPFDEFTIDQLAGDMLPSPTRDQLIATGFNRNHRLNGEGGRIEAEWFVETVIDRVETTGLTWLGLTFNCCRCHDHKFDPISQREFYQLFAFFNSGDESGVLAPLGKNGENTPPLLTLTSPESDAQLARLQDQLTAAQQQLALAEARLPALQADWEQQIIQQLQQPDVWQLQTAAQVTSAGGAHFQQLDDASWLASGINPPSDTYDIDIPLSQKHLTGLMLEFLPHADLPGESLGRGSNGNFVLTDVVFELRDPSQDQPQEILIARAAADYEQPTWVASSVITRRPDSDSPQAPRKGWAVDGNDPAKRLPRRLMFVLKSPLDVPPDAVLHIRMRHLSPYRDHNTGRFRFYSSQRDAALLSPAGNGISPELQLALQTQPGERTPAQTTLIADYFRMHADHPVSTALATVKAAEQQLVDFKDSLPTTMVMRERSQPRDAFILTRGEYDRPGEKVQRGLPAFLPPLPEGASADRLGLARWIVDPSNPLTARVWVNREWERFFGTGLVKTSENLGSQAEFPSHPELLDWLAVEFMQPSVLPDVHDQPARAWDMKAMQKLILTSHTYQQSSVVHPAAFARDPENRLVSRASRFRLNGESLRDQALFVSGLLVKQIGGPSVRPYMPEGVWDETSKYGNLRGYVHDRDDGLYRRSLYTIWKRTAAPPTLLLFDAPNREVCTIKRSRTNTPLQALALLNEVTFVEAARALATRLIREAGPAPDDRLTLGYRLTLGRPPTSDELHVLLAGIQEDLQRFQRDPEAASSLIRTGDSPVPSDIPPSELAAWTLTANILLNLDEFLTRE